METCKNRRKPKTTSFPIRKYSTHPGPWAKSDKEKAELFAEHLSEVLSPSNNNQGQEVEQDLATPTQSQERHTTFTSKEIKDEVKMLNQIKAPGLDFITARTRKTGSHIINLDSERLTPQCNNATA